MQLIFPYPNLNNIPSLTGDYYLNSNPSGFVTSGEIAITSGNLQTQIDRGDGLFSVVRAIQRARILSGPYSNLRSTTAGVGTTSTANNDAIILNATGAGAYSRRDFWTASAGYIGNGMIGTQSSTSFGRPCFTWVTLNGFGNGASLQSDSYRAYYFGKTNLTSLPLSAMGWGFLHEGTGNSFRIVTHNGTSLTSGDLFQITNFSASNKNISVVMYSNGSGSVSAWVTPDVNNSSTPFDLVNSLPSVTITGGPTGAGGDVYPAVEVYAGALGGGQNRLDSAVFGVLWG